MLDPLSGWMEFQALSVVNTTFSLVLAWFTCNSVHSYIRTYSTLLWKRNSLLYHMGMTEVITTIFYPLTGQWLYIDQLWPSGHTMLIMSLESCDQYAFLIGFPEVLQNLPWTSCKIQLNHEIPMMILLCPYLPWGMRNGNYPISAHICAYSESPSAQGRIIYRWKGISDGNTMPLRS